MPRFWALAVALSSVLSGCMVVGAEVGDAARKRTLGAADEADSARASLHSAIEELRGPAITFRYTATVVDTFPQVTNGTYFAEPERWAATTRFTDYGPGGRTTSTMRTVGLDGTLFASFAEWRGAEKGCWAAVRRGFAPFGVTATRPERPVYVGILDQLRPAPWAEPTTSGLMTAQVRFHQALALLPAGLERRFDLKDLSAVEGELVNLVVEIADGRVLSVTVTRSSLVSPLEAAGLLSEMADAGLRATTLKVVYPLHAAEHAAERPPDELLMSREDIAARRGCQARGTV